MRFYAFNPLAGGILSGKYRFDQAATTGRYAQGTVMGNRYRCAGMIGAGSWRGFFVSWALLGTAVEARQ